MSSALLRLPAVQARTGYSRSTLYLRIGQGLWTKPISLGGRAVAWPESEVQALVSARIAGQSNNDIKSLVHRLVAKRVQAFVE